ncbi:hypothetical protein ACSBR2_023916 [Camellia fascicularis]
MDGFVLMLCSYGRTNAVIRLHQALTFTELISGICGKFEGLDSEMVVLFFEVPGYNKFCVLCDEDVRNMFSLAKSFGLDHVDVIIQLRNRGDSGNGGDGVCMVDGGSKAAGYGIFCLDDRTDLLQSYCQHRSKTYLSAGWASGIANVGQCFMGGADEFRTLLSKYAVECGFQFKYVKNDSVRVTAVCLFSVAFAIVDSENASNWEWFLRQLLKVVDRGRSLTFVYDRHIGLLQSMSKVFPLAHHAFCIVHLQMNLRDCMKYVNADPAVVGEFLKDLDPKHWANGHFGGRRYGEMSSNATESFNNWIWEARHLPITQLVDAIRGQTTEQMSKRRMKVVSFRNSERNIYDSIEPYYHVSEFKASYSESIHPIPTVEKPIPTPTDYLIAPPVVKRPPGRPKRKRIPSRGEVVQRIWCG